MSGDDVGMRHEIEKEDSGMIFIRSFGLYLRLFMKTYLPKVNEIEHKCYVIDAKDKILGKVAAKAASVLRGKHKRIFTPFLDTGDTVIIINAEKVKVTGKKLTDKVYSRYTGYPSGSREMTLGVYVDRKLRPKFWNWRFPVCSQAGL